MSKQEFCTQKTEAPVMTYQAHSAPLDFNFYTASQFPTEYRNDAFVTILKLNSSVVMLHQQRAGRFILATNVLDAEQLSEQQALEEYKG